MSLATSSKKHLLLTVAFLSLTLAFWAMSGCAPQNGESNDATSESATVPTAWSADVECVTCHNNRDATTEDPTHLAVYHSNLGLDCATCHVESDLITVHEEHGDSGRTPTKLRYTSVKSETCLSSSCHKSYEDLAQKTAGFVLTDKDGKTVNPHELPQTEGHASILCSDCHVMHETGVLEEIAIEKCYSCHHERKFECGTCHD